LISVYVIERPTAATTITTISAMTIAIRDTAIRWFIVIARFSLLHIYSYAEAMTKKVAIFLIGWS